MRTWMAYACALLALGLIMWRLSLDLKLTSPCSVAAWSPRWCSERLLLLGLNGLRRALARVPACHGGWDSASCCGTRWPPPDRAWPSA